MNLRRPTIYLCLAAVTFTLAGQQHAPLLQARKAHHLNLTDPIDNAPPMVAFTTVALGGFRGIIADALWIRAARMQQEGRYFELVQLSDWITKLEPRFTTVWAFHAWNMSYNVSVMFSAPEDRWRWVRHGLSLLTEEGLRYNPGAPDLYRELGWMYQHKISATQDSAHWYYKQQWFQEMSMFFPDGKLPAAWHSLPISEGEFIEEHQAQQLAVILKKELGSFAPRTRPNLAKYQEAVEIHRPDLTASYLHFSRRYLLENQYRLSFKSMRDFEAHYGNQDWRRPQVHAAFWAYQGREDKDDFSQISLQRMISQSFADLFLHGNPNFGTSPKTFYLDTLPSALPSAQISFREAIQQFPEVSTFSTAYQNFLQRAVLELWLEHKDELARAAHTELETLRGEEYPFEELLRQTLLSLEGAPDQSTASLQAAVNRKAQQWRAKGRISKALRYESILDLQR